MPAPHNPRTAAATEARKLKAGEVSEKVRIRGGIDLHAWLSSLSPQEIGGILEQERLLRERGKIVGSQMPHPKSGGG